MKFRLMLFHNLKNSVICFSAIPTSHKNNIATLKPDFEKVGEETKNSCDFFLKINN